MIIDKNFSRIMEQVFSGKRFTREETRALVDSMIDGAMSDVRIAAVLTGLRFAPLTEEIMLGAIDSAQRHTPRQTYGEFQHLVDCSGTGGDSLLTVNISTMAALVAAAAGAQVAKFGSRSVMGRCGSADVLEAVGVRLAQTAGDVTFDLSHVGISFLYSPAFYPGLRHISAVRKSLGFHTLFDVLVPLANPVALKGQLIGVYAADLQVLLAKCLVEMGRERALVVHSDEGLDEISVCGPTRVIKVMRGTQSAEIWKPADFGIQSASPKDLQGGGAEENSRIFLEVIQGVRQGPILDAVLINAAAVLWCAGVCDHVKDGLLLARTAITSGAARVKLESWQKGRF